MYVCILDSNGQVVFHKDLKTGPDVFLKAVKPFMVSYSNSTVDEQAGTINGTGLFGLRVESGRTMQEPLKV